MLREVHSHEIHFAFSPFTNAWLNLHLIVDSNQGPAMPVFRIIIIISNAACTVIILSFIYEHM